MSETRIDTLSPAFVGEDRISLGLDDRSRVLAQHPITLRVDYSKADDAGGIVLPLLLTVQPEFGDGEGYFEKIYDRFRPNTITFSVDLPGSHLVTLRETAHNRWQGRLRLDVAGERGAAPAKVVRGAPRAAAGGTTANAGTSTAGIRGATGAVGPAGPAGGSKSQPTPGRSPRPTSWSSRSPRRSTTRTTPTSARWSAPASRSGGT